MKLLNFFFAIIVTMTIVFVSCKKDNNSKVSVSSNKLSATIEGIKYDFTIKNIDKEKRGDTITLYLEGYNKDSTKAITLAFVNQIGINGNLALKKYNCSGDIFDSTKISVAAIYDILNSDTSYFCMGDSSNGSITILYYDNNDKIQGSYDFIGINGLDTSKKLDIRGEFDASFKDNIKDLPIALGKMTARANNELSSYDVFAAEINKGRYSLNITGISNIETIVLQFVGFKPKTGKRYIIGPSIDGEVTGSYIYKSSNIYFADSTHGSSGSINIVKVTPLKIEGTFQFTGVKNNNLEDSRIITNGMFNARFDKYNKK